MMKSQTASTLLVVGIVAVGLMGGCTAARLAEGPSPATRFDRPETNVAWNNVALLDDSIARKIEVQRSGARRTPTDSLEVFVVFRNRTDYPQQIECRVQFFDQNKFPAEDPSSWQRLFLDPNAIVAWKQTSMRGNVSFYYVEVREGR